MPQDAGSVAVESPSAALVPVGYASLSGWADDDHAEALHVFRKTADLIATDGWAEIAGAAAHTSPGEARDFFERHFEPVLETGSSRALFTGYYEPEIPASLTRSERFRVPVHAPPPELADAQPWASRAEIEAEGLLEGRGLELAWLETEVDRFFLQVQGSGRLVLPTGTAFRVGYAGRNGHPYRSIGAEAVRRGLVTPEEMSAQALRALLLADRTAGLDLMRHNPSYVFFRVLDGIAPEDGPIGTMGRAVTPGRSLAVDPAHVPLGAPVWLETDGRVPLRRLMIAQDTGSAIKGPQRADVFCGTGSIAGEHAGAMAEGGRMVWLQPRTLLGRG